MGYRKKRERMKEQKALVFKKRRRERKWEKESSHALLKRSYRRETSQRNTTSTKYTTHMHLLINLYDLLLLVIQVFDVEIDSIQVSYAFTPTLSST
jgi:hypothetical protein